MKDVALSDEYCLPSCFPTGVAVLFMAVKGRVKAETLPMNESKLDIVCASMTNFNGAETGGTANELEVRALKRPSDSVSV